MAKTDISLQSEGLKLKGEVYFPYSQDWEPSPALCLCHGIPGGGPPDPNDPGYPALAERFSQSGFITAIFNFRGTGDSEGNFDIAGWTRDLVSQSWALAPVQLSPSMLLLKTRGFHHSLYAPAPRSFASQPTIRALSLLSHNFATSV